MKILKILWKTMKLILTVLFGYVLLNFTFQVLQGPEVSFDLGDRYQLNSYPGTIIYWKSEEHGDGYKQPFIGLIDAFYIKNPWVIGKTTKSIWFAIQKSKHETHYPLRSLEEVKGVIGLNINESDIVTNPYNPWFPSCYEIVNPWVKVIVGTEAVVYVAIVYLLFKKREQFLEIMGVSKKLSEKHEK